MHRILPLALAFTLTPTLQAEEHTVSQKPFHVETTLKATFLPAKSTAISIKPEVWSDFIINSLVPQGAAVKKGDTLIGIDTRKLDKYLAEAEKSRASAELALAQAKHELAQLEISTPRSLEASARHEKETAENLKWYMKVGHAKEIEETKRSVKIAQHRLDYQKEELKQLLKMYGEDNKIEETEEIILTRTRNHVDQAEFALKSAQISAAWALDTSIPRKLKSAQRSAEEARIANADAKKNLPRKLKQKQLAVAKAERDDEKSIEKLAKLKADRAMMEITAPADGVVYYGSMEDGRWNPASAVKVLKKGGALPGSLTLMTLAPSNSTLELSAFVAETSLSALSKGAKGYAVTGLNSYRNFPVAVSKLATHPETNGSYAVTLSAELPKGMDIVPGMKATAKIISRKMDKALTVPADYLTRQPNGSYTVKLKLADGKTENRKISISTSNKDSVVVTKGLEKGQVIVK